jgi:hypothetical protein
VYYTREPKWWSSVRIYVWVAVLAVIIVLIAGIVAAWTRPSDIVTPLSGAWLA